MMYGVLVESKKILRGKLARGEVVRALVFHSDGARSVYWADIPEAGRVKLFKRYSRSVPLVYAFVRKAGKSFV